MLKEIPEIVTSGFGCKEDINVQRFHSRTAGMLYFFRCCGIRLSHWEISIKPNQSRRSLCNILKYVTTLTWHRTKGNEVDIETISLDVYEEVVKLIDRKWMEHQCSKVRCVNKFIIIDGNEKLFRLICSAENLKIIGQLPNMHQISYSQKSAYSCLKMLQISSK